ncbi:MAG: hypothetical protein LBT40_07595 [Deltaproteobacteria bacterium]|jgi:hypothetical protein|nr:hypothetical protein [Deltaproteobacteria bacterium]
MPLHPFPFLALAFLTVLAQALFACRTAHASANKRSCKGWKKSGKKAGAKPSTGKMAAGPRPGPRPGPGPSISSSRWPSRRNPLEDYEIVFAHFDEFDFEDDDEIVLEDDDEFVLDDDGSGYRPSEGWDDWTPEARAAREHPRPPKGWPQWRFGDMGRVLETERLSAEKKAAEGVMLEAAHAWDNVRALARLLLGPRDPRVWAALSRSARSLGEHATEKEFPKDLPHPSGMHLWVFRARGAASMAAQAVEALGDPGLELAAVAMSAPGSPDGTGDGLAPGARPGSEPGPAGWDRSAELDFARETHRMIARRTPSVAGNPPPPLRSLADALYPGTDPEAGKDPFPPSGELRKRLRAAEGPGGPGPGSRESLVLRSLLGAELWDTGAGTRSAEALEHMREACMGLDGIVGERAACSLEASERLARRLGGMYGRGTVLPDIPEMPDPPDLAGSVRLFRDLERLAPAGPEGDALRRRAATCASALSLVKDGEDVTLAEELCCLTLRLKSELMSGLETGSLNLAVCRGCPDMGELLRRLEPSTAPAASMFFNFSIDMHRNLLGGRHPETAAALARSADMWNAHSPEVRPCSFWAHALEALEGLGERYETFRAELELRLVPVLAPDGPAGFEQSANLQASAAHRLSGALGETAQPALKAAVKAGFGLTTAGREDEAEEVFTRIVSLLDGAPPRRDPDLRMPSDAAVLSAAMAGKGAAMIRRGDKPGGRALLIRSSGIAALATAESDRTVKEAGDCCRKFFLDMKDGD